MVADGSTTHHLTRYRVEILTIIVTATCAGVLLYAWSIKILAARRIDRYNIVIPKSEKLLAISIATEVYVEVDKPRKDYGDSIEMYIFGNKICVFSKISRSLIGNATYSIETSVLITILVTTLASIVQVLLSIYWNNIDGLSGVVDGMVANSLVTVAISGILVTYVCVTLFLIQAYDIFIDVARTGRRINRKAAEALCRKAFTPVPYDMISFTRDRISTLSSHDMLLWKATQVSCILGATSLVTGRETPYEDISLRWLDGLIDTNISNYTGHRLSSYGTTDVSVGITRKDVNMRLLLKALNESDMLTLEIGCEAMETVSKILGNSESDIFGERLEKIMRKNVSHFGSPLLYHPNIQPQVFAPSSG